MISKFAAFNTLLLASVALAAPSLEARLARRRANRQSQPINRVEAPAGNNASHVEYSSNWAGAVWNEAVVYIIPIIYNHVRSNFFLDRELSPLLPGPL